MGGESTSRSVSFEWLGPGDPDTAQYLCYWCPSEARNAVSTTNCHWQRLTGCVCQPLGISNKPRQRGAVMGLFSRPHSLQGEDVGIG